MSNSMEDESNQTSEPIPNPEKEPLQFGIVDLFKLTTLIACVIGVFTVYWMGWLFSTLCWGSMLIGSILFIWIFLVPEEGRPW